MNPYTKIYLVGSGKGGVGKSTVAVNLSIALSKKGLQVGLLDADVYGPSIPIMLGLRRLAPREIKNHEGKSKVLPFTKFGIKSMSIGFFIEEAKSILWRGPMLHNALQKMLDDIEWGDLDVLIIDLPPGTGDVPISLSKLLKIDGAIIVCTPQEVAMLDAVKAINALHVLDIPLLGVIENMAGFTVPGTNDTYDIFGKGKAHELSHNFNTSLLGSIPLIPAIVEGGDIGYPATLTKGNNQPGAYFDAIAENFLEQQMKCEKR
jgi:ATP-binding protein involved in chromosome partitioning